MSVGEGYIDVQNCVITITDTSQIYFVTWGQLRVTSEFTRYCSLPVITMSKRGALELNFVMPNGKKSRYGFTESWLRSGTEISPGCGRGRGSPSLVTGGLKFFFLKI